MSILGTSDDGREIKLNYRKRTRGLYCIGTNGTGKTTFLVNLALQDIENGHGLCYLDPHGDAIKDILKRIPDWRVKDVIYLSLDSKPPFGIELNSSFGLNLFDCPDPTNDRQVALTSSFVTHVFERVWGEGLEGSLTTQFARIAQFIRNISVTMISNPGMTFAEIPFLLQNKLIRDKLVANVKNEQVKLFWNNYDKLREYDQQERSAPVYNRVDAFLTQPIIRDIIGQSKTTIDFSNVMDKGKILLIALSPRYEDITKLLGTIIIGRFLDAAYARAEKAQQERRFFGMYVDEFQRYVNKDMEALLTEARKFNVGMVIAHQVRDQLDIKTKAATLNVGNLVVFKVIGKDGEELAPQFNNTPPQPKVIGQRPVLSPKREVIQHLLQNGHSNPKYLEGVKFLIALQEVAGMPVDKPHFRQVTHAQGHLPESLIAVFQQKQAAGKYQNAVAAQVDLRITIQQLNNHLYKVMQLRIPDPMDFSFTPLTIYKAFEVYDLIKMVERERPWILCSLRNPDKPGSHDDLAYLEKVASQDKKWKEKYWRLKGIYKGLHALVTLLAAEPIMVNSGQYEDIYDHDRAYADVQNQIATELVNLPKFTAKIKLEQEEYTIKTLPFSSGADRITLNTREIHILYNNYSDGYLRESSEVEKEIRKRQEDLLKPPEPPAGSRIVDIDL